MRGGRWFAVAHAVPHGRADHGPVRVDQRATDVRAVELLVRFGFGALIALAAGVIGLRFGPRAGGLFLAFPAILPAAVTLLQRHEGRNRADASAWGAVAGAAGMIGFAVAAALTLDRLGLVAGMLIASAAWVVVSVPAWAFVHAWLHGVME